MPGVFPRGQPVSEADLAAAGQRWPLFAPAAAGAGFAAVQALPLRLRDEVIGAMNMFMHATGRLDETGLLVGQALADVATIGLLHERNLRHQEVLAEQLQGALNSRIAIEQAKGVVAERLGLDMGQAFEPAARSGPGAEPAARRAGQCGRRRLGGHGQLGTVCGSRSG